MTFSYEVRREGEHQLLCTGHTVHACIDADGRVIRFPPELVALLRPDREPPPSST